MDQIFEVLMKYLVCADTAMVGVTIAIIQIVKYFIPSEDVDPDGTGPKPSVWSIKRKYQWIPFASAFVVGMILSMGFAYFTGAAFILNLKAGLQTGALAVIVWEAWSSVVSPTIDFLKKKLFG